jgi:hypothetical protein
MKTPSLTLLDLVQAVNEFAATEAELVATVTYLVNSGRVRLGGSFAGARIALPPKTRPALSPVVSSKTARYTAPCDAR